MKNNNEVNGALNAVSSAKKFINTLSVLKKATITATAVYVAVMVFKVYRNS
ncbi:MAG TPA: hypothetical protein VFC76_00910 [Oscillospiraceae bacterium]|nr:hypothetical protein [Oscillospiraceae bacterium]